MARTMGLPKPKTPGLAISIVLLAMLLLTLIFALAGLGIIASDAVTVGLIQGIIVGVAGIVLLLDTFVEKGRAWDITEIVMAVVGGLGLLAGIGMIVPNMLSATLVAPIGTLLNIVLFIALAIALFTRGSPYAGKIRRRRRR